MSQAKKYYDEGCDEILYIDVVASLYDRPNLTTIVECARSACLDASHGVHQGGWEARQIAPG